MRSEKMIAGEGSGITAESSEAEETGSEKQKRREPIGPFPRNHLALQLEQVALVR